MIGQTVSHYRITEKLGQGGMGEVYRAEDTNLSRQVAIKVLPDVFAGDPERLARFEREAKLLASLNHPNIAAIHGLEESDGKRFIVMELVEGQTLAHRLLKGPLPVDEALEVCRQIAEGLEAAHEKGVIHRDLKPGNVMLTPDDKVKILDFGLARVFDDRPAQADQTHSPTITEAMTRTGTILGTAAYMSPEQAKGKPVDRRTDIWAFGCITYECLTGKRMFQGETVNDTLAKVIETEPDWGTLPVRTPPPLRKLLLRCLQKEVRQRFRDAADVRMEIEDALSSRSIASVAERTGPAALLRRMPFVAAAALLMAVLTGVAAWYLKPSPPQPVSRLTISLPPGQRLAALDQPAIVISPDGKNIVYVATQSPDNEGGVAALGTGDGKQGTEAAANGGQQSAGPQRLYLRPLDSLESTPIAGTEGAVSPFFSPDGQWIGFFADGKLKKVSLKGGQPFDLSSAPMPRGATWSSQGILAFQPRNNLPGLQQVSEKGGTPQPLVQLEKGAVLAPIWPEFLPGGKTVLFSGGQQISALSVSTGERKNLVPEGAYARYSPTGHLLYAQSGTLMAAPFDERRLVLSGEAVPVIEGLMQSEYTRSAQYSVSATGTLIYLGGGAAKRLSRLVWVSRNGEERPIPCAPRDYEYPRVSPDGRRVSITIMEQQRQLWIYDLSRDKFEKTTFEGANLMGAWSPDGKRLAFQSSRSGPRNMFWQASDGSGRAERLLENEQGNTPSSFSRDGKLLAFIETNPETLRDIWVMRLADRKVWPFLKTPAEESGPEFSPDGKWIAYWSDESGRREVFVQPYPGPGGKRLVSIDGGDEPVWNPKGGELFYRSGNKLMAVDVNQSRDSEGAGADISIGKPHALFEGPYLPTFASFAFYGVSPDGQRFLMLRPVESPTTASTQINVVQNWLEELKRLVPVK